MTSQESDESDTRFELRPARREHDDGTGRRPPAEADDLGVGASNRAVSITLAIGIGLMLLVLMLPYLNGR